MSTVEKHLSCLICGALLARPRTGRPPAFCGDTCRRFREQECRRALRFLERLEVSAAEARVKAASCALPHEAARVSREAQALASEVSRAEGRLRALMAEGEMMA